MILRFRIEQFAEICVIESVKAASDSYAPLTGKVTAVNERLIGEPQLTNTSSYNEGWIAKISNIDKNELENLMNADAYKNFLAENE